MDQVFITDLVARGIIGVHDWERQQPQDILINIVLFADLRQAGQSDNVLDSVDYQCQRDIDAYCLWTRRAPFLGAGVQAFGPPRRGWRTGLTSAFLP